MCAIWLRVKLSEVTLGRYWKAKNVITAKVLHDMSEVLTWTDMDWHGLTKAFNWKDSGRQTIWFDMIRPWCKTLGTSLWTSWNKSDDQGSFATSSFTCLLPRGSHVWANSNQSKNCQPPEKTGPWHQSKSNKLTWPSFFLPQSAKISQVHKHLRYLEAK